MSIANGEGQTRPAQKEAEAKIAKPRGEQPKSVEGLRGWARKQADRIGSYFKKKPQDRDPEPVLEALATEKKPPEAPATPKNADEVSDPHAPLKQEFNKWANKTNSETFKAANDPQQPLKETFDKWADSVTGLQKTVDGEPQNDNEGAKKAA